MIISKNNYASMLRRAIEVAISGEDLKLINKSIKHYEEACVHEPKNEQAYISDHDYAKLMIIASYSGDN